MGTDWLSSSVNQMVASGYVQDSEGGKKSSASQKRGKHTKVMCTYRENSGLSFHVHYIKDSAFPFWLYIPYSN